MQEALAGSRLRRRTRGARDRRQEMLLTWPSDLESAMVSRAACSRRRELHPSFVRARTRSTCIPPAARGLDAGPTFHRRRISSCGSKVLSLPGLPCAEHAHSRRSLHFPSRLRRGWTSSSGCASRNSSRWAMQVADPELAATISRGGSRPRPSRQAARSRSRRRRSHGTRTWRLRRWLLEAPALGAAAKALARRGAARATER